MNYYNENDPRAAAWLRELIKGNHIAPGEVDERSITDVHPNDLAGFCQCHFFAGIGGWSYALRLAGWPDEEPVWTGSCPCQPLSCAGNRKGHADQRHLWPAFYRLIAQRHPATVFGEQVAGKDGREWLAGIRADMEGTGYAVGSADLCAAGLGSPQIRQRLFWVGHSESGGRRIRRHEAQSRDGGHAECASGARLERLANPEGIRQPREQRTRRGRSSPSHGSRLGHPERPKRRPPIERRFNDDDGFNPRWNKKASRPSIPGAWDNYQLIPCRDGKARRIESGTFPLVDGLPGRVGLLRGYGNAIVPQVAAEFIQAYLEAVGDEVTSL